jgi:hypothetical protein
MTDSIADKSEWFMMVCTYYADNEPKPFRPVKHQKALYR